MGTIGIGNMTNLVRDHHIETDTGQTRLGLVVYEAILAIVGTVFVGEMEMVGITGVPVTYQGLTGIGSTIAISGIVVEDGDAL